MVSINPNFLPKGTQKIQSSAASVTNDSGLSKLQTTGNNIDTPPCEAIIGGSGTKDDPYIIDGKDDEADMAYFAELSKRNNNKGIYFIDLGSYNPYQG